METLIKGLFKAVGLALKAWIGLWLFAIGAFALTAAVSGLPGDIGTGSAVPSPTEARIKREQARIARAEKLKQDREQAKPAGALMPGYDSQTLASDSGSPVARVAVARDAAARTEPQPSPPATARKDETKPRAAPSQNERPSGGSGIAQLVGALAVLAVSYMLGFTLRSHAGWSRRRRKPREMTPEQAELVQNAIGQLGGFARYVLDKAHAHAAELAKARAGRAPVAPSAATAPRSSTASAANYDDLYAPRAPRPATASAARKPTVRRAGFFG